MTLRRRLRTRGARRVASPFGRPDLTPETQTHRTPEVQK